MWQFLLMPFRGSVMHAPLNDDVRAELLALFRMHWSGMKSDLTQDDWAESQRLCEQESPDFILNHPDYFAFFTYSLSSGTVPI